MSAQPFSVFYDMIRPWAKKAPLPAVDNAIRDIARDFCVMSKYRRESLDPIDVWANQRDYPLVPDNTDEEVFVIEAAQYTDANGFSYPLSPSQPEQDGGVSAVDNGNTPQAFWLNLDNPNTISLWPLPQQSVANALLVRGCLQPTKTATTIDSTIIQQHDTTIAWGALWRLLCRQDEPWTNLNLAVKFQKDYREGVNKALTDAGLAFMPYNTGTAVYRYG